MTSKRSRKIKLACISDLHVGWRHFDIFKLIDNLNVVFFDNPDIKDLDLIVWAGDVFDDLLKSNSQDLMLFETWFSEFLRMCHKHDISVYILEGTKSHDWGQSERLVLINERLGKIGADLTYVNNLSIRYDKKFDLYFLFVPDDLHHDTSITFSEVQSLLQEKQLEKVDFAFMHGNFGYQLPKHLKLPCHDEGSYLSIVKYLIFIGHVHTPSQYDRIYAQGSFDRKNHGEEENKGFLIAEVFDDDSYEIEFIINHGSHVFKTIDVRCKDLEEARIIIDSEASKLNDGDSIRVFGESKHPVFGILRSFMIKFPLLHWTTKEDKVSKPIDLSSLDKMSDYKNLIINRDNIKDLLLNRIRLQDISNSVLIKIPEIIESLR